MTYKGRMALVVGVLLLGGLWLSGCLSSLCTKHLYIFRDTPEKSGPATGLALLITDPEWVNALGLAPGRYPEPGCPWTEEKPAYDQDAYRLSIDKLDGQPVFQGWCFDSPPTLFCEVRPGKRRVGVKFVLAGTFGRETTRETAALELEPGAVYFLRPDCAAMQNHQFVLKMDRLPGPYSAEIRNRLIDRRRQTMKGIAD